jgi:hypothetical protein
MSHEMTVQDLIEALEDFDPDSIVRLAFQPSWPLQFDIANVRDAQGDVDEWQEYHADCDIVDFAENRCDSCGDSLDAPENGQPIVYIVEGGHPRDDSPYAPRSVFA